ncbi:MAG: hypothetical protein AAGJ35_08575, partial [Myxococcota bacterium]
MRVFLDTSAWIKFFIAETGTQKIQDFLLRHAQTSEFLASTVRRKFQGQCRLVLRDEAQQNERLLL